MPTFPNSTAFYILIFLCIILTFLFNHLLRKKNKKQLDKVFILIFLLLIFFVIICILQIFAVNKFNTNPIIYDKLAYISLCFLPVATLFLAIIFAKTKITFKKRYLLLLLIPSLSLILLWTNDFHHLFYKKYSFNFEETEYGIYFSTFICYFPLYFNKIFN